MNYEDLYQELALPEKSAKDKLAALQKSFKAVCRETDNSDLKSLAKDIEAMKETIAQLSAEVEKISDAVASFDTAAYFENGDFAAQMLAICQEENVNVIGDFPVYEMFPYRIKLDTENQDIYMDRKKVQCMRPKSFVELVKNGQERLTRASFNPQTFANELAEAYDLALLKAKKQSGYDIYLTQLYKLLAPMSRYRKDYDQQSFAFDLARLYGSGIQETKSGRKFQFGPSRKQNKAIRILDQNGREQYLSTICFYAKEADSFGSDTDAEKR